MRKGFGVFELMATVLLLSILLAASTMMVSNIKIVQKQKGALSVLSANSGAIASFASKCSSKITKQELQDLPPQTFFASAAIELPNLSPNLGDIDSELAISFNSKGAFECEKTIQPYIGDGFIKVKYVFSIASSTTIDKNPIRGLSGSLMDDDDLLGKLDTIAALNNTTDKLISLNSSTEDTFYGYIYIKK